MPGYLADVLSFSLYSGTNGLLPFLLYREKHRHTQRINAGLVVLASF